MGWLERYYGSKFEEFSPQVVREGKTKAVVRLAKGGELAFVLVHKAGKHSKTPHQALHNGQPSADDLRKMVDRMQEEDER